MLFILFMLSMQFFILTMLFFMLLHDFVRDTMAKFLISRIFQIKVTVFNQFTQNWLFSLNLMSY